MITLDEAIERENALAYSYGERYKRLGEPVGDLQGLEAEHRQIAEWLRELKAYKTFQRIGEKLSEKGYTEDDFKKLYEEVNTDGNA